jgi:hypothetical protein
LLQDIQERVEADLAIEHMMIKDELEQCISAASASILRSHRDATAEVISIIELKDTAWMEALCTMRRRLENVGETQLRTEEFYDKLHYQQQELDKMERLLEKNEKLEASVKDLHQELAALAAKSREPTLLEMTQAAGTAGNLAAGIGNMLLITTAMKMLGEVLKDFCSFTSSKDLAHLRYPHGLCNDKEYLKLPRAFQVLPSYPFETLWDCRQWVTRRDPLHSGSLEIPNQIIMILHHLIDEGSAQGRINSYFLPADGIHHDVLITDAPLYLVQPVAIWAKINMVC